MSLLKQILVVNNECKIVSFEKAHLDFVFNNLKDDDKKELSLDCSLLNKSEEDIKQSMLNDSKISFTAKRCEVIMFCAGLYNKEHSLECDENNNVLWLTPTINCEKYKVSYVKLAIKMMGILRGFADGAIYTYTPLWYKKNIHATKDLGFEFLKIFEINGERFLLSRMEVNNG